MEHLHYLLQRAAYWRCIAAVLIDICQAVQQTLGALQDKVKAREAGLAPEEGLAVWVTGEAASVEVEISNPTASAIKVHTLSWRPACVSLG